MVMHSIARYCMDGISVVEAAFKDDFGARFPLIQKKQDHRGNQQSLPNVNTFYLYSHSIQDPENDRYHTFL